MTVNRRFLVSTGLVSTGVALGALLPTPANAAGPRGKDVASGAAETAVTPNTGTDQSKALQAAIDRAAERGTVLILPPGRYLVQGLRLRAGSHIRGTPGRTILAHGGPGTLITGEA